VARARWIRTLRSLALIGAFTACDHLGSVVSRTPWVRDGDAILRETTVMGIIDSPALNEGSGIVPAGTPGLYWALNDSGNDPLLYLLSADGHVQRVVAVSGVKNRDWEALSRGPCPQGTCLFIGDVGDNDGRRESVRISWLPEPAATGGLADVSVSGTLTVRYADGAHDVEAMYVAPDTSIWLVTKRPMRGADKANRPSHLHRVRLADGPTPAPLAVVDSVPVTPTRESTIEWITDASLSPVESGGKRRLALLTYGAVHVLEADALTGYPGRELARCALPIRGETAEGVTWTPDGRLLILSEGNGAPLHAGKCP
jgi:hypothetical protein